MSRGVGATIVLLGLLAARPARAAEADVARVEQALGLVTATASDGTRAVRTGDALHLGDLVATGPRSRARLRLADESIVALGERTRLRLTRAVTAGPLRAGMRLDLLLGRLWLRVTRAAVEFVVGVPAGTVKVKGTVFVVEVAADGTSTVIVLEGRVLVAGARDAREVTAGFQTRAHPGRPLERVRQAPPATLDAATSAAGAPGVPPLRSDELRDALTRRLGVAPADAAAVTSGPTLGAPSLVPPGPLDLRGATQLPPLKLPLSLDPAAVPVRVHGRIEFRP